MNYWEIRGGTKGSLDMGQERPGRHAPLNCLFTKERERGGWCGRLAGWPFPAHPIERLQRHLVTGQYLAAIIHPPWRSLRTFSPVRPHSLCVLFIEVMAGKCSACLYRFYKKESRAVSWQLEGPLVVKVCQGDIWIIVPFLVFQQQNRIWWK